MSLRGFPNRVKIKFKWAHAKPVVRQVIQGRAGYTCAPNFQIAGNPDVSAAYGSLPSRE